MLASVHAEAFGSTRIKAVSRNQTQAAVEIAVDLATHAWIEGTERTYERLLALCDYYADHNPSVGAPAPKVMVWTEALRRLRERVPDCLPEAAARPAGATTH